MAAALFERRAGGRHRALSAGSRPAERVHPEVVAAMRELGIDLADRRPQKLTPELANAADVVVTMGCGDACPAVPGALRVDWNIPDPAGKDIATVREIRDHIAALVDALLAEIDRHPLGHPLGTGPGPSEPRPSRERAGETAGGRRAAGEPR
ncbi:MAG: heat-shock protein HtpX [Thermoleophilum sp.]|nr:heat-shock protein HtpX [Thermoleophilum sp.]